MAKRKEPEDTRDVFDKALDYAPIGGAVLGGALGGAAMRRLAKRSFVTAPNAHPSTKKWMRNAVFGDTLVGAGTGAAVGYMAGDAARGRQGKKTEKGRRK